MNQKQKETRVWTEIIEAARVKELGRVPSQARRANQANSNLD